MEHREHENHSQGRLVGADTYLFAVLVDGQHDELVISAISDAGNLIEAEGTQLGCFWQTTGLVETNAPEKLRENLLGLAVVLREGGPRAMVLQPVGRVEPARVFAQISVFCYDRRGILQSLRRLLRDHRWSIRRFLAHRAHRDGSKPVSVLRVDVAGPDEGSSFQTIVELCHEWSDRNGWDIDVVPVTYRDEPLFSASSADDTATTS